jgi:hypothetical protein
MLQFQAEDTPDEKLGQLEHALSQYRFPVEDTVSAEPKIFLHLSPNFGAVML